ncbi:MAG: glycosyltransferase [Candidatus Omnitrophota bacterium]|jgi:glycosyltransferase involved in cell wall biosynthesis
MKIVFVTREGYNLSGARVRCYNFARELKKLGLETEVFSFADNLGALYGEREREMGMSKKISLSFQAAGLLRKASRDSVFYIQRFNYHSLVPLWASGFDKNRIIFDCDDWNIRENPEYYFGFYPSSKMEYCTRRIARQARVCIAASFFLKEYLEQFSPNVQYIPTGVDTGLFKPAERKTKTDEVRFSWIGTVYHEEMRDNLYFILDCFSQLASRYGNITLSLAGEGSYLSEIKSSAAQSPYKDRIRIEGWIPPENIPAYLAGVDAGLLPLIQDTKFNRAKSPTKLFEYMAMGKPALCSAIGEAGLVIADGENGMLARSKEEFIEKMKVLIEKPELGRAIGARARETAEREYSLEFLAKKLYLILTEHASA